MQLAVKQQKSKFIEHSNKFNHYFYELKRAKFGAIMEMCSMWMSQDSRARRRRRQRSCSCSAVNNEPRGGSAREGALIMRVLLTPSGSR